MFSRLARTAGVVAACGCFIGAMGMAPGNGTNNMIFTAFAASGGGVGVNDNVDGLCKLKWRDTTDGSPVTTNIQLTISGLAPDTSYGVSVQSPNGAGAAMNGAFTTNHGGHGSWDAFFISPPTAGTTVTIFFGTQDDPSNPNTADIRAVATN